LKGFVPSNGFTASDLEVLYNSYLMQESRRRHFSGKDLFNVFADDAAGAIVGLSGLARVLSGFMNTAENRFEPSPIDLSQQTVLCPIIPREKVPKTVIIIIPGGNTLPGFSGQNGQIQTTQIFGKGLKSQYSFTLPKGQIQIIQNKKQVQLPSPLPSQQFKQQQIPQISQQNISIKQQPFLSQNLSLPQQNVSFQPPLTNFSTQPTNQQSNISGNVAQVNSSFAQANTTSFGQSNLPLPADNASLPNQQFNSLNQTLSAGNIQNPAGPSQPANLGLNNGNINTLGNGVGVSGNGNVNGNGVGIIGNGNGNGVGVIGNGNGVGVTGNGNGLGIDNGGAVGNGNLSNFGNNVGLDNGNLNGASANGNNFNVGSGNNFNVGGGSGTSQQINSTFQSNISGMGLQPNLNAPVPLNNIPAQTNSFGTTQNFSGLIQNKSRIQQIQYGSGKIQQNTLGSLQSKGKISIQKKGTIQKNPSSYRVIQINSKSQQNPLGFRQLNPSQANIIIGQLSRQKNGQQYFKNIARSSKGQQQGFAIQNKGGCQIIGQGKRQSLSGNGFIKSISGDKIVLNDNMIIFINQCTKKTFRPGKRQFAIKDRVKFSYFEVGGVRNANSIQCY
jgi:hypothetical protein